MQGTTILPVVLLGVASGCGPRTPVVAATPPAVVLPGAGPTAEPAPRSSEPGARVLRFRSLSRENPWATPRTVTPAPSKPVRASRRPFATRSRAADGPRRPTLVREAVSRDVTASD